MNKYLIEYQFETNSYALEIMANSEDEAINRVKAMRQSLSYTGRHIESFNDNLFGRVKLHGASPVVSV